MSEELNQFNSWYSSNYNKLWNFAKRNKISQDLMHSSYIKIVEKIEKSGYQTNQYMTYCKRSMVNMSINDSKKSKQHFVDTDDSDFKTNIEMKLLEIHNDQLDSMEYQEQIMYLSKMLFSYIDSCNYSDQEKFIFRSYFLVSGRVTYKKLHEITKINKNILTKTLTKMKRDIRENLECYIKEKNNKIND